jgi:hypothetical protein
VCEFFKEYRAWFMAKLLWQVDPAAFFELDYLIFEAKAAQHPIQIRSGQADRHLAAAIPFFDRAN